jgi:alanine racemase
LRRRIIAVVKANAYGHGARRIAATLEAAGATMLAVADIEEGVDLRKSGIRAPILIFGALSVSDLDGVFDHDLTPTISSPAAGHALQDAAAKRGVTLRYHLKIDTGMESSWLPPRQPAPHAAAALASKNLVIDAVHTHFGRADEPGNSSSRRSAPIRSGVPNARRARRRPDGCGTRELRGAAARFARVVRLRAAGLLALRPRATAARIDIALKPVMSLTSQVVAVKGVRVGETRWLRRPLHRRSPVTLAVIPRVR